MSFEKSYTRNLTHKYRLAVAIAVLKEKPDHLSTDEYIEELRNRINNDSVEDLDLTVCSDDFNIDDNDETINDIRDNDINISFNEVGNINDRSTNDINVVNRDSNESIGLLNDAVYNDKRSVNNEIINHNEKQSNEIYASCSQDSESIFKDLNEQVSFIKNGPNQMNLNNINKDAFIIAEEHEYASQVEHSDTNVQCDFNLHSATETRANIDKNTDVCLIDMVEVMKVTSVPVKDVSIRVQHHSTTVDEGNMIDTDIDATYYDSQATILYTIPNYSQNYTHVSQSQNYDQIVTNDKFIKTKANNILIRNEIDDENKSKTIRSENMNTIAKDLIVDNDIRVNEKDNLISDILSIEDHTSAIDQNAHYSQSIFPTTIPNSMGINETFPQYAQNFYETQIYDGATASKVNEFNTENDTNRHEMDVEEISSNETEIVSFKVVEELNKVKNYINRRVERRISNDGSIESGYRSDSQKSSYRSSLQLSGNWLNQSAHSLYQYIARCPLLSTTQEIVNEMAQVLGQLIDRLHEEEKYPSFLEDLLENVGHILQEVFHEGGDEDALLKKDDDIQRLLLLNTSVHIQRYTLEKIAHILEELHIHLTNPEEMYEVTHTNEIENTSYIFHILEVLLQKYSKNKLILSQDMNSQNELKRTSIADIWRRKWNPNYKEECGTEEITPKKCVLLKCNEVLNRIVVSCMEGYSLIAFSALQCFNMLQS